MNDELSAVAVRTRSRNAMIMILLAALIAAVFLISMNTGAIRLTPLQVLRTLFGGGTDRQELILFDFRLPRIVVALLVGSGLAVAGCIMQGVTRNALAEPGILGINAGAGFAVLLFVAYFPTNAVVPVFTLPLLALAGAAATALLIFALSYSRHEEWSPIRLILTGIAVAAGINAATIVIVLSINEDKYQFVANWVAGSIWGTTWKFVLALLPWIVVLVPFVFYKARMLDVLNLGERTALGLGAPINRERGLLLAAAVALAGSCVAVSGGIGFVGLIGPHLARRLVGPRHGALLPASALAGSLLLLTADTVGRWAIANSEIPAGIVVAIIGAPYFLYLLAREKS